MPLIDPEDAVIVTVPGDTPVANPPVVIVATVLSLDFHVADSVMSVVVLFE